MNYWLMKSEPGTWSWEDQLKAGIADWDGVRNHQAANNMKVMNKGDQAFFYHSGKGREIVGVVEIVKEYHPDPTDESERFGMVSVKALETLPTPVPLKTIKADERLAQLPLVRQPRLSVMPVDGESWRLIRELGGVGA
ncbi:MAG: EVE domain-containing protein [Candidatus Hydrogenedentota bacterium]